jgi:hypothetical protein
MEGSELMGIVQDAMIGHLQYTTLRQGVFTHTTVAEGLTALFANVLAPTIPHWAKKSAD